MKFSIKRAGILVAILATVVLAIAGYLCAISVGNGSDSNLNSIDTNIMTTADKEYLLEGSLDEMAEIWNSAMLESVQYNKHIKLTLMNDWVAKDGGAQVTMFGEGFGFETGGRIRVVAGAVISLDLNGCSIDRNLTNKNLADDKKPDNASMRIYGTLNLLDSKYDIAEVNRVYEQYKGQSADATDRVLLQKLSEIKCGKITGNDSRVNGTPGIHVDGTLNMYGGMIIGNKSTIGYGGGIQAATDSIFNMYNGAVIGNSNMHGGGIYVSQAKVCNIQGGIIAENKTGSSGGGIMIKGNNDKSATIANCIISHNRTDADGGGIWTGAFSSNSFALDVNIDNVEVRANYAGLTDSAIRTYNSQIVSITNTIVTKNVSVNAGSVMINTISRVKISNVQITDNITKKANVNDITGGTASLGIVNVYPLNREMYVVVNNVLIANNEITESNATAGHVATAGMHVAGSELTLVDMRNVRIVDNKVNGTSLYSVGGLAIINYANIRILDNVIITNNHNEGGESNLFFREKMSKLTITTGLETANAISRIGVTFRYAPESTFTIGYSIQNSTKDPNKFFYSDNTDKKMIVENGEVKLGTETKPTQTALTWKYKANSGNTTIQNITGDTITLEYNPNGYTITNSANSILKIGATEATTQEVVTNVGTYIFTIANSQNYTTPTIAIVIVPKKVDIVWSNTELTYNGNSQIPTAKVVGDDTCSVTRIGAQTNVGNGYVVTATALGNTNYEINPATRATTFSIKPANLTINVTTKSYTKEYNGKVVKLPDDWYSLSATLLGQDKYLPLNLVFDIDHTAFIPQFNGADSATAVGEYTISTKPFNANEVFTGNGNYNVTIKYNNTGKLTINKPSVVRPTDNSGYDFLTYENGRRVNYKDKDWIHGDNDSDISTFILGNIAPNTSIQTFVSNLSFDITKITIYNRAGDVVYGTGAIDYYVNNINNGREVAVGTGWRIEYTKLTGGEETIYLSVLGDLTGDGKVNSADVNYIRKLIGDPTMFSSLNDKPYIQLSALIINNGKLTNADGEILWNIVCGKMDIVDFL